MAVRQPRIHLLWLAPLAVLYFLPPVPATGFGEHSAVMVQPNLSPDQEWTAERAHALHRTMVQLTVQAALADPERPARLLLWPEVPAPLYYYDDARFREQVEQLARAARAELLFGTVSFTPEPDHAPLNSAVMLGPDGQFIARYDKINLVPFGEYVPEFFNFINRITQEAGDFRPGAEVVLFPVAGRQLGAFICYESVFPDLVRRFAAQGAGVLVNLSNDGYFGRSAARRQHLKMVRMRAVENRRWVLRATNNGITASINPSGRVVEVLPTDTTAALRATFSFVDTQTFYTRHGNWFVLMCAGVGLFSLLATQIPVYRREE